MESNDPHAAKGAGSTVIPIRRASAVDADAIRALVTASWARTYDPLMGEVRRKAVSGELHGIETIRAELDNPAMVSLVVPSLDGALCGYALVGLRDDATVHLHRLHVDPAWKGTGLAGHLLEEAEAAFPRARTIDLEVFSGNLRAVRFYERSGYRRVRILPADDVPEGLETLVMERALPRKLPASRDPS